MTWLDDATQDIRRDEELRLKSYEDPLVPGVWTIGYGDTGVNVVEGMVITTFEAEQRLSFKIANAINDLNEHAHWWTTAPDPVRRGLLNMCYNMGYPRLSGFTNMLACGEMGNYSAMATAALDSKWARQVKGRAERIADLYRSANNGITS